MRATGIRATSIAAIVCLLMCAATARAASPDSWTEYHKEVGSRCIDASGLRNARPAGSPVDFDDRVGYTALVIQGQYPQLHMKNRSGRVLCLFDKRSRSAHIAPADAMIEGRASSGALRAVPLEDTHWKLVALGAEPKPTPMDYWNRILVFQRKPARLAGSTGCNRLMGSYKLNGDTISFGRIASTRMACPAPNIEGSFLAALERVRFWKITGRQLELFDSPRVLLARFEARPPKANSLTILS